MKGSAIETTNDGISPRGADRVDLFTGPDEFNELVAGSMKQKGALYFLLKKEPPASQ